MQVFWCDGVPVHVTELDFSMVEAVTSIEAMKPLRSSADTVTQVPVCAPMRLRGAGELMVSAGGSASGPSEVNAWCSSKVRPRGSVTTTSYTPAGTPAGTVAPSAMGVCQATDSSATVT